MKKNKKAIIAYISFIIVFALQFFDVFYIHKEGSLFGENIIARVVGIAIALIASIILRFNVKNFCFKSFNWFLEVLYGIVFAAVPFTLCLGSEYILLMLKGYENLKLNIWFPNTNNGMSIKGTLLAMGLFTLTILIEALFKELFFRGFLITQFFRKYGIRKSNVIQAALFTLILIPETVKRYISGDFGHENNITVVFIIGCIVLTEFMSGIKWGLYYRVNGTVWMATVDHFLSHMLSQCLYVTYGALPVKWAVLEALAVQTVSFVMFVPLYFKRDKLNEEIAVEIAVRRELAGLHVDNYSPSPVRRYIENRNFEKQKENARKKNLPEPKKAVRSIDDLEEAVSLKDSGFFPEPASTDFKPRKSVEAVKKEIAAEPREEIKKPYEENAEQILMTNSENADKNKENEKETGASNISKLVNEYFEENFNKHTF